MYQVVVLDVVGRHLTIQLRLTSLDSKYQCRDWYDERIQPWVHYIPVAMDYSDLSDRLDWALAHDAEASAIAARGAQLVSMLLAGTRCKWHACEVCADITRLHLRGSWRLITCKVDSYKSLMVLSHGKAMGLWMPHIPCGRYQVSLQCVVKHLSVLF